MECIDGCVVRLKKTSMRVGSEGRREKVYRWDCCSCSEM